MEQQSTEVTSAPLVVLLAEDETLVRNVVRTALTRAGYTVLDAGDGEAALEVSRGYTGSIHVLLTDLKMPRMNGLELSAHITRERPEIKVLLMSGKTSDEPIVIGQQVEFLRKPFLPNVLRAKLSELLS